MASSYLPDVTIYLPDVTIEPERAGGGSPLDCYLRAWRKYVVFGGRATRREFWTFWGVPIMLTEMQLPVPLPILLGFMQAPQPEAVAVQIEGVLATMYVLAALVPAFAVGFRRMHDTDHSGWWLFVLVANLIFLSTDGPRGRNRFGPDPKVGGRHMRGAVVVGDLAFAVVFASYLLL